MSGQAMLGLAVLAQLPRPGKGGSDGAPLRPLQPATLAAAVAVLLLRGTRAKLLRELRAAAGLMSVRLPPGAPTWSAPLNRQ